jgi:hypothetical protein
MQQMHQGIAPTIHNNASGSSGQHVSPSMSHGSGWSQPGSQEWNGQGSSATSSAFPPNPQVDNGHDALNTASDNATSLDELVAGAARAAENAEANAAEALKKLKKEKDKDKNTKMIYSDNEVSPEEKMARLPRYAFVPDGKENTVMGNAIEAPVPVLAGDITV